MTYLSQFHRPYITVQQFNYVQVFTRYLELAGSVPPNHDMNMHGREVHDLPNYADRTHIGEHLNRDVGDVNDRAYEGDVCTHIGCPVAITDRAL